MTRKSLIVQTLFACLFLLTACDVAQSARNDFNRLTGSSSSAARPAQSSARPGAPSSGATSTAMAKRTEPKANPVKETEPSPSLNLSGKSEGQLREMLGPPTSVEERAPGKTWHYRDGQCALDVQLYPDVQTRQFGTLAYEVKSDDNTDEGRRTCMARLGSRGRSSG